MTTNRSRPSDRALSRQTFLRGAVGVLASGAVFRTARAVADPDPGWGGLASSIGGSVLLPANGTQFATVGAGDTAFSWRQRSAVLQWYVEPAGNQVSAAYEWLSSAHQAVQQFSVGGYVNYIEANASPARYFGSNLPRLTSVRQKYDPNRIMFSGSDF